MNRLKEQFPLVYLKSGETYFSGEPAVVVTVLGSCLSITMFNRRRGVGAICHCPLPICSLPKECYGDCVEGLKYVDCSIQRMVRKFGHYKVQPGEIDVKCFGGADMFTRRIERPEMVSVGRQNIISAEKTLNAEGLKLNVKDVGGVQGRKIFFYTHTGEVLLKRLR